MLPKKSKNEEIYFKEQYRDSAYNKFQSGDLNGAIAEIERSLEIDANYVQALIDRAIFKAHSGDIDVAVKDFQRALEIEPKNHSALMNMAIIEFNKRNFKEALNWCNSAIYEKSDDAYFYSFRCHCRIKLSDYFGAIQDIYKSFEIDSNSVDTHFVNGLLCEELGDICGAIYSYSEVIKNEPKNYVAYYNRGRLVLNPFDKLIDFHLAIKYSPIFAKAYTNSALAWLDIGEYEKGILDATKAIELSPNNYKPFNVRAILKCKIGDKQGAAKDFKHAYDLGDIMAKKFIEEYC